MCTQFHADWNVQSKRAWIQVYTEFQISDFLSTYYSGFMSKSMQAREVPSLSRGVETEVGGLMGGTPVFCGKEATPFACVCSVAGGAEGNVVVEEKSQYDSLIQKGIQETKTEMWVEEYVERSSVHVLRLSRQRWRK